MKEKFVLIVFCLSFSILANGDGFLFIGGLKGTPQLIDQGSQIAYINYEGGLEKMIIGVATARTAKNVFWLFPIPALPTAIKIDVLYELPFSKGKDVFRLCREKLDKAAYLLSVTQIYPSFFLISPWKLLYDFRPPSMGLPGMAAKGPLVTVYEHIEKYDVVVEKITAKDGEALFRYLKGKGLGITRGSIPILNSYIGRDYTFIVSWLSSAPQNIIPRALYLSFPASKIYYPLLPTSIYGEKSVDINVAIVGYHELFINGYLGEDTDVHYFYGSIGGPVPAHNDFLPREKQAGTKLTKLHISAPAKLLSSDLWIEPRPFRKAYYADFLANHIVSLFFLIFFLSSIMAGTIAGKITLKKLRDKPLDLILLGLTNLFSLGSVIIATIILPTDVSEEVKPKLDELRRKGYIWKRRLAFSLFCLSGCLMINSFLSLYYDLGEEVLSALLAFAFIFFLLAVRLSVIKEEDKHYFLKLKENGYSRWFLGSANNNKLLFVLLFSLLFLTLVNLLITILKLPLVNELPKPIYPYYY